MKKNRKMIKSTLAMLLVFALFLPLLVGCGEGKEGKEDSGSTTAPTENTASDKTAESGEKEGKEGKEGKEEKSDVGGAKVVAVNKTYNLEGNDFELVSYCLMEDYDGDTDIVMTWKFTNNEDEAQTSLFLFFYDFMQGEDLVDDPGNIMYEGKDGMKTLTEFEFNTVDPGKTGTFFLCYKIKDEKKPVKAIISGLTDKDRFEFEMPIEGLKPVTVDDIDIPE